MKLSNLIAAPLEINADCLVIPILSSEDGENGKPILLKELKPIEKLISEAVESKVFTAKVNSTLFLRNTNDVRAKNILFVGLGDSKDLLSKVFKASKTAGLVLKQEKISSAAVYLPGFYAAKKDSNYEITMQSVAGFLDATYDFNEYKSEKTPPTLKSLTFFSNQKSDEKYLKFGVECGEKVYQGLKLTKDLANTPPSDLSPDKLVNWGKKATAQFDVKATIFDKSRLEKEKMGGILGVGQASAFEPRLLILEYKGPKASSKVCLVGKGVTFDSGGIDIKPSAKMEDMKYDMSGAAMMIGSTLVAAALKLPIHLITIVPSAENMVAGNALRPSDVITMHNGKTVEINNTDAEGRLILGDALSYAHTFKPDVIVDSATLTGGVVVALGSAAAGLMGNSDAYINQMISSSKNIGEKVWQLPLFEEYKEDLLSGIADYRNSGARDASSSKGGTFLNFFIQKEQPWIHLDIAAMAYNANSTPTGNCATGWGVRLIIDFLSNFKIQKSKK